MSIGLKIVKSKTILNNIKNTKYEKFIKIRIRIIFELVFLCL